MMKPWVKVQLGELARTATRRASPVPGTLYRLIGVKLWGEGAYEREGIDGAQTKYAYLFRTEAGDIIVNKIWARNGSVAVVPECLADCYGSGEFPMFAPDRDRLYPRWMHWLTKTPSFWAQCDEKSRGTSGKNRIRPEQFLRIEIPLPPLEEQRRIVARIEELAAQINEARTLRRQAVAEAGAAGSVARNALLVNAADKFGTKRLEELTSRITKGESPEWQGFTYHESGPVFIRSENVLWGSLATGKVMHICDDFHNKLSRSQLRPNDILINLVGASIGRACIVPFDLGKANVNQAVAVISPRNGVVVSEFLVDYLLSPVAQDQIHGGKVETARPNISLGDLRDLMIPIPPLEEQRRIVAELDTLQVQVGELKRLQSETAAELDALLPAILDRAFKGEL